ncbi:hypothetical protein Neosp_010205 [[Neocosmospora] mangrovei]
MRAFTLVTSACANICSKVPASVFTPGSTLVHHFLAASRGMLMCYEDQDVSHPESSSLSIRVFQAVALHTLGKIRLSWLALVMRLFDEASYSRLDQVESQLRKNVFWILYVSDKSASVLNNVPTTLHEAHLDGSLLTAVSADQDGDQPCLLEDADEPLYKAPYESQLHIGFRLSQRLWSLAADLLHDIRILSRLNYKTSPISEPPPTDSFQRGIIQSYMAFCSALDAMPPWLRDPESHAVQDAEQSATSFQRRTFWIQHANLLVTFHCLRLILLREASAQGLSALFGVTNNPDMLALRNTEISHELLTVVTSIPFEALQANGEPLVEKLRQVGVILLEISHRAESQSLSSRAKLLFSTLLDAISKLDSKVSDELRNAINRPEQLSLFVAGTKSVLLDTGHSMVASGGLFAPTIRYHDGVFYIVCTNAGHGGKTLRTDNFVISTTDIWSSNWSDPIPIPFKGIDPGLFFDDDGRVYFHGCFLLDRTKQPSCTITQFEIDIKTGTPISEQREIWQGHARYDTEGPHIYKLGKWYYLLVAEGGTFEHHMLSISRSESIWGPYEDFKGNPILTADGKADEYIQNTGHGDLFQDANSQWWAAVLGVRNEKSCQPLGRETFLTPVDWPDGSWPVIAQPRMEFTGLVAMNFSKRSGNGMDVASRWNSPARVEDLFIRDPDLSKYKLPDMDNGSFVLLPSQSGLSTPTGTSTFIGRRQRNLNSTATTVIDITTTGTAACRGVKAGLTVYKDHMRHVSLVYDFDAREVVCHACNASTGLDRTSATTLQVRETTKTLGLKIIATSARYRLLARETASELEEDWLELGSCETQELAAREMTGPVFGTFAHTTIAPGEHKGVTFLDLKVENH